MSSISQRRKDGASEVTSVLHGVRVLDLSWGIAGPMTTMLLADQGADVTKIEPPGGDPFRRLPEYQVWQRGKRSAVIDLQSSKGVTEFRRLARSADVVVESFRPGTSQRLGVGYEDLASLNPRLIYCSITGYGRDTRDAQRPAYDALVAARSGLQWELRGWPGSSIGRISGEPPPEELDVPEGCTEGADRPGPLFSHSAWPSLAACYLA